MNYYNEFDPAAAAWLRELIAEGLIPAGDVDERSIEDVRANDLLGYSQCHFFAGIGGWSLALRLAGWPDGKPCWTGSCPCQAFSTAGQQKGFDDERDLWPMFAGLIRECRPEYVFGEQVENAIKHGWLDRVYADLERENYAVGAVVLGAHSVGAPHRRQRLYWGAAMCRGGGLGSGRVGHVGRVGQGDSVADRDAELRDRSGFAGPRGRRESSDGVDAGGLSDAECAERWPQQPGDVNDGANAGRDETSSGIGACRESSGVAQLQGDGRNTRRAESGGRSAAAGCCNGGMADAVGERQQERCDAVAMESQVVDELPGVSGFSPWGGFRFVYCRDGKVRRIPAESLFFGMADGISESVDGGGLVGVSETGGFPLTTQKEGRAMLLKGYGNAIVPQVAAEFVVAFRDGVTNDELRITNDGEL